MLAGQVADLAFLRRTRVAGWGLAALGGVEVGEGLGAVAVGRHGLVVDVVHWIAGRISRWMTEGERIGESETY